MIKQAKIIIGSTKNICQMMEREMIKEGQRQQNIPGEVEIQNVWTLVPGCSMITHWETKGCKMYKLVRIEENGLDLILQGG